MGGVSRRNQDRRRLDVRRGGPDAGCDARRSARKSRGDVMSRRNGNGAPHAPATAATAEPAIYYKTPVTPEEAFQAIGRLRRAARDEIDRLIQFLDKTDDYVAR